MLSIGWCILYFFFGLLLCFAILRCILCFVLNINYFLFAVVFCRMLLGFSILPLHCNLQFLQISVLLLCFVICFYVSAFCSAFNFAIAFLKIYFCVLCALRCVSGVCLGLECDDYLQVTTEVRWDEPWFFVNRLVIH